MTNSTVPNRISVEYQFRWYKPTPLRKVWRVEGKNPDEPAWSRMAIMLLRLLTVGGKQLYEWSSEYVVWREPSSSDLFRARSANGDWVIENKEWGEVRWFDCSEEVINRALSAKP